MPRDYFLTMTNANSNAGASFDLFETAIGVCAIVWTSRGICGVQLPERNAQKTLARVKRRYPSAMEAAAPPHIRDAIVEIVALLEGEARDLSAIALDLDGIPDFNRQVYDVARKIGPGATITYGEIATKLGDRLLARDVGQALGKNPIPIIVPCHRVLAANGKTGGFSAPGGVNTKMRMLSIERARTSDQPMLFDQLDLASRRRG
ncbi:MAG: methylated-DNA--[protein]-cysteine S-methyltransferase [Xanthobacteraceae bacterium]